jgi:hypothetical protein
MMIEYRLSMGRLSTESDVLRHIYKDLAMEQAELERKIE